MSVPWDSLAGSSARQGLVIYTYAPKYDRHFDGIDTELAGQTDYMLSLPIRKFISRHIRKSSTGVVIFEVENG